MVYVRELSQGMVTPDDDILDVFNRDLQFITQLRESAVLVESSKSCKVLLWD